MRILVTGGAGFIGSSLVRLLTDETDAAVTVLDALTYAGDTINLAGLEHRIRFVRGDVCDPTAVSEAMARADAVIHLAAESHVDRSIASPQAFVQTNVVGTQVVLDGARAAGVARVVHVSTDEVYGALGATGRFSELSPLRPTSPYAASKAAAEMLVRAWHETYGLPTLVSRCGNNFGPRQTPEKLIPLVIHRALHDQSVPVYGDGRNVREWVHVEDHCRALVRILEAGRPGHVYNVGSGQECSNLVLVEHVLRLLGKPRSLITFVSDRPAHDSRYALDSAKLRRELGWKARQPFRAGLEATVAWYAENPIWLEHMERRLGTSRVDHLAPR